jgi:cytidylate kinase
MVMATTVSPWPSAWLRCAAPIRIHDCANVATSFPNFLALCHRSAFVWRKRLSRDIIAPVITIDGPSGSGKGTFAGAWPSAWAGACWIPARCTACWRLLPQSWCRPDQRRIVKQLAAHLDVQFVGATEGIGASSSKGEDVTLAIRNETVAKGPRKWRRRLCARLAAAPAFPEPPGLVADGRDMGTVVFLSAAEDFPDGQRRGAARRRYLQLKGRGWC